MSNLSFSKRIDAAIFAAVALVLLSLIALLASNLAFQYLNYRDGIKFALADPKYIDHASVLIYSRAWDFAVVKTSSLFLSFLLIFTGALYVLRVGETNFQLAAEKGDFKGSLSVTSPGLVMVTLGVALAAYVLSSKTYVEYNRQGLTPRVTLEKKGEPEPVSPTVPLVPAKSPPSSFEEAPKQ